VRAHWACPMVVDIGQVKTHVSSRSAESQLTRRTHEGWKTKHLIEEGYWTYNMPRHSAFRCFQSRTLRHYHLGVKTDDVVEDTDQIGTRRLL
jgi:hypothetical protein